MLNRRNLVIVEGFLGKDPETHNFESGNSVCRFPLAVDDSYRDKNGEEVKRTYWLTILAWNNRVKLVEERLRKGSKVQVWGKITTRTSEAADGSKNYHFEIVAEQFTFFEKNGSSNSNSYFPSEENAAPVAAGNSTNGATQSNEGEGENADDDLPF